MAETRALRQPDNFSPTFDCWSISTKKAKIPHHQDCPHHLLHSLECPRDWEIINIDLEMSARIFLKLSLLSKERQRVDTKFFLQVSWRQEVWLLGFHPRHHYLVTLSRGLWPPCKRRALLLMLRQASPGFTAPGSFSWGPGATVLAWAVEEEGAWWLSENLFVRVWHGHVLLWNSQNYVF